MIGTMFGLVFEVTNTKLLTFRELSGSAGADWASHDIIGRKPMAQWTGPKARKYSCTVVLMAQYGVRPRATLEQLQRYAESGAVDWFVVGGAPLTPNQMKLNSVSDTWDVVLNRGELMQCTVKLELEEYL